MVSHVSAFNLDRFILNGVVITAAAVMLLDEFRRPDPTDFQQCGDWLLRVGRKIVTLGTLHVVCSQLNGTHGEETLGDGFPEMCYQLCEERCRKSHFHRIFKKKGKPFYGAERRVKEKAVICKILGVTEVFKCELPVPLCLDRNSQFPHYHELNWEDNDNSSEGGEMEPVIEEHDGQHHSDPPEWGRSLERRLLDIGVSRVHIVKAAAGRDLSSCMQEIERIEPIYGTGEALNLVLPQINRNDLIHDDNSVEVEEFSNAPVNSEYSSSSREGTVIDVEHHDFQPVPVYQPSEGGTVVSTLANDDQLWSVIEQFISHDETNVSVPTLEWPDTAPFDLTSEVIVWLNVQKTVDAVVSPIEACRNSFIEWYRSCIYHRVENAPSANMIDPDHIDFEGERIDRHVVIQRTREYTPGSWGRLIGLRSFVEDDDCMSDFIRGYYNAGRRCMIFRNLRDHLLRRAGVMQTGSMADDKVASWLPSRLFELVRQHDDTYLTLDFFNITIQTIAHVQNLLVLKQTHMLHALPKHSIGQTVASCRRNPHPRELALDFQ